VTSISEGRVESFAVPASDFYYWKADKAKDLLFLLAREPDMHWKEYSDLVFQVLKDCGGKRIYSIGGVSDYVPHTREVVISAVVSNPKLRDELSKYGVESIEYKGPASLHTLLSTSAKEGVEVISLWGQAPVYITQNPKVYYAVLRKLVSMLEVDIDLEDMRRAAQVTGEHVNEQVRQSPELRDLVRRLEEAYDKRVKVKPAENEDLIKGIEEWLKGQRRDGG
jgi:proteasome assembly chaperone (PAC2) family protein